MTAPVKVHRDLLSPAAQASRVLFGGPELTPAQQAVAFVFFALPPAAQRDLLARHEHVTAAMARAALKLSEPVVTQPSIESYLASLTPAIRGGADLPELDAQ